MKICVTSRGQKPIEKYKKGQLRPTRGPSVNSKFGMPGKEK